MGAACAPTRRSAAGVVNGATPHRRKKRSTLWQRATLFRVEFALIKPSPAGAPTGLVRQNHPTGHSLP